MILCLTSHLAAAGFLELGATANYRRSTISDENYQESISYTGSISYYFWEMSAIEVSYTQGYSKLVVTPFGGDRSTTETDFSLLGLDLVLSFAGRKDMFQPYIKVGGAHISKEIYRQSAEGFSKVLIAEQSGVVPSAGIGFKIKISERFSVKVGVDAWTSPLEEDPVTVDFAGRAGISWFL